MGVIFFVEFKYFELGIGFVSLGIIDVIVVKDMLDEEYFGFFIKVYCYIDFDSVINEVNNILFGLFVGLLSDDSNDY